MDLSGGPERLGRGTAAAYRQVRTRVRFLEHDRPLTQDIEAVADLIRPAASRRRSGRRSNWTGKSAMKIWTDADVEAFLKVIDPADDATGGGTASAVAGAMAAGLVGMVARVSKGKPDLESDEFYDTIDAAARQLTQQLMQGGREDSEAFGAVMDAYRLPKETEEDRGARTKAIRAAMVEATRVPLSNAQLCVRVLELADRLATRFNENAASDLACARSLAGSGAEGCLANVAINLPGVKDEEAKAEMEAEARECRSVFNVLSGESDG